MFVRHTDHWVIEYVYLPGTKPTFAARLWARVVGWSWRQRAGRNGSVIVELRRRERRRDRDTPRAPWPVRSAAAPA